ncbi:8-amino-7-oxononanoate synthase [Allohahella marinimesophila]|uniref:8-amino-7-oxononanoate synthase n=1 Tax=Allohahella marinimesophila TaxID=1054972 RepID=A0ABP7PNV7_9GAMM
MPLPASWGLEKTLAEIADAGQFRQLRLLEGGQGARVTIDGRTLLNFSSNDYLGLAAHPAVGKALKTAVDIYGVGSGASHLVCGHTSAHAALEDALARLTGRSRVLLYSTGYMANLGVASALLSRQDVLLQDKLNHASLLDAAAISGAKLVRYRHADMQHLEERLAALAPSEQRVLVSSDSVFSMDGDVPDLNALASCTAQAGAALQLDDAHGLGVLGEQGGGACEAYGLDEAAVPVLMGTFGKALGTAGAFVAGSEQLIETLIQKSRTFMYTTAMPPALAAATSQSIELLQSEGWRRPHLQQLIAGFRKKVSALGLDLMPSDTAIQPLLVGEASAAVNLSKSLLDKGFLVVAIRPPTVPAGQSRLRITLSAAHDENDVDQLVQALAELVGR